jgi:hypothetical protein
LREARLDRKGGTSSREVQIRMVESMTTTYVEDVTKTPSEGR